MALPKLRTRLGATALSLLALAGIAAGVLTIPVQAQDESPTDGSYYYYYTGQGGDGRGGPGVVALPDTGRDVPIDGTGGRAPLTTGGSGGDIALPLALGGGLLGVAIASAGLSTVLRRRS